MVMIIMILHFYYLQRIVLKQRGVVYVDELKQLVDLEIRQAFPQFNPEEFVTTVTPMEKNKDGIHMMMATIVQMDILETIKEIFQNNR